MHLCFSTPCCQHLLLHTLRQLSRLIIEASVTYFYGNSKLTRIHMYFMTYHGNIVMAVAMATIILNDTLILETYVGISSAV